MALHDMVNYIYTQTHKEVDDQLNTIKIQATQSLIALGEELEKQEAEKLYRVQSQIQKRENMLKSEQDFLMNTQQLLHENEFTDELLIKIKQILVSYVDTHKQEYQNIVSSWLSKVLNSFQQGILTITIRKEDQEFIQKILTAQQKQYQLNIDPLIKAGFICDNGQELVDLSFDTLFIERKQQLLDISMRILKEKS